MASRGAANKGVDFVLTDGTMVEAKAWSHLVWERLKGSTRDKNMLNRLQQRLTNYLENNSDNLAVEFAWKIPDEVLDVLSGLKGDFGDRISWFGDVLKNGGRPSI